MRMLDLDRIRLGGVMHFASIVVITSAEKAEGNVFVSYQSYVRTTEQSFMKNLRTHVPSERKSPRNFGHGLMLDICIATKL